MDKGRQIDNIQNTNARYIDNFGQNQKTSVKIAAPPGGQSSFSFGWSADEKPKQVSNNKGNNNYNEPQTNQSVGGRYMVNKNAQSQESSFGGNTGNNYNNNNKGNNYNDFPGKNTNNTSNQNNFNQEEKDSKTSVRVKQAPGGSSSFEFGSDNNKTDDFRKNR